MLISLMHNSTRAWFRKTRTHTSMPPFVDLVNFGTITRVLGSSYAIFYELTVSLLSGPSRARL